MCANGQAVGLVALLEPHLLPPEEIVLQEITRRDKRTHIVQTQLLTKDEANALDIPALKDEPDVLRAFMKFLERGNK